MESFDDIEQKRLAVVKEMLDIKSMKRGTINEQFLKVKQKGHSQPVLNGPYYVFSRREGSRTVSERLTTKTQLEQARRDIAAYKTFQALCKEFEVLTEQLGVLERQDDPNQEKKRRSSPSRPTTK